MNASECLDIIDDAFVDFHLSDQDRPKLLFVLFMIVLQEMIEGPTPIILISSDWSNAGKTKLVTHICSLMEIKYGMPIFGKNEESCKKELASVMITNPSAILWDNVRVEIKGGWLEAFVTAHDYPIRLLGGNNLLHIKGSLPKFITANSPAASKDMSLRMINIHLPHLGKRDESDFKHHNITKYQRLNAGKFQNAVYGFALQAIKGGMKEAKRISNDKFYNFEILIGGILDFHGIDYDLSPRTLPEHTDMMWIGLMECMEGKGWLSAKQIMEDPELSRYAKRISSNINILGKKLSQRANSHHYDPDVKLILESKLNRQKTSVYRCVFAGGDSPPALEPSPAPAQPNAEESGVCTPFAGDAGGNIQSLFNGNNKFVNSHKGYTIKSNRESPPAAPSIDGQSPESQAPSTAGDNAGGSAGDDIAPASSTSLEGIIQWYRDIVPSGEINLQNASERLELTKPEIHSLVNKRLPGGFVINRSQRDPSVPFQTFRLTNTIIESGDVTKASPEDMEILTEAGFFPY